MIRAVNVTCVIMVDDVNLIIATMKDDQKDYYSWTMWIMGNAFLLDEFKIEVQRYLLALIPIIIEDVTCARLLTVLILRIFLLIANGRMS